MTARLLAIAIALVLVGCASEGADPTARPSTPAASEAASSAPPAPSAPSAPSATSVPSQAPEEFVVVAAGDIAGCEYESDSATAALVAAHPEATVAALGDLVYPAGGERTYRECYDPVWGAFRDRTRPALGNHDVEDDGGDAFFAYFGDRAGDDEEGWYSYDLGSWHVVVLNSNCEVIDCAHGSPQHEWLVADLAASDAECTLAYWHHPRFSSGPHGSDARLDPFWDALHAAGADVVLGGHDHLYERFAPQAPDGTADPDAGIRQFTAGTGGKDPYELETLRPNSEAQIIDAFGVLRLVLGEGGYEWSFLTVDGAELDPGSDSCH